MLTKQDLYHKDMPAIELAVVVEAGDVQLGTNTRVFTQVLRCLDPSCLADLAIQLSIKSIYLARVH